MYQDLDEPVNLNSYSILDSCYWLLNKLRVSEHVSDPYMLPYSTYILSWHKSIPINAIILMQSPYPNNIYPPIAAAMSYNKDLCRKVMKVESPPTVEVLANDLKIHASMKREDTISILENGWFLVDKGILLVNERVFERAGGSRVYNECVDQCNLICRMLRETENYGERTIDLFAFGNSGKIMASYLCRYFKSDKIKLSKHTSQHPASLSYRMNDYTSEECHLDSPTTSKKLAKCLSNYVAEAHTMPRKSEQDLRFRRQADSFAGVGRQADEIGMISEEMYNSLKELLASLDENDIEKFKQEIKGSISGFETLQFRARSLSAAMSQAQAAAGGMGDQTARPGPSTNLEPASPSASSLSHHASSHIRSHGEPSVKTGKIRGLPAARGSVKSTTETATQSINEVIDTKEENKSFSPKTTKLSGGGKSTKIKNLSNSSPLSKKERSISPSPTEGKRAVSTASQRIKGLPEGSKSIPSGDSGSKEKAEVTEGVPTIDDKMKKRLSCIDALVQVNAKDKAGDSDVADTIESIQNDIKWGKAYNGFTIRAMEAINKDLELNPKFDMTQQIVNPDINSNMFIVCKEEFDF